MSKYAEVSNGFEQGNSGQRPHSCEDAHLEYLDDLRKSGKTNMFGARPYLMCEFSDLTDGEAAAILGYWMKTFGKPTR